MAEHHLPPEDDTSDLKHASPPPRRRSYSSYYGHRNVATTITVILLILAIIFLVLWLVYRPHNRPTFNVAAAAVYSLNVTTPPFLAAAFQFTIVARNPNRRVSILYDRLTAYVTYRNQPITVPVPLPPLHHHTKTTVALSPIIGAEGQVPVSVEVANGLEQDQAYGVVPMTLVVVGKLRWKAASIRTRRHDVYVSCDVWVGLKSRVPGPVPLLGSPQCRVDV
ncbi:NDR1/HIN1-like protein 1 [Linum grandiflorum]